MYDQQSVERLVAKVRAAAGTNPCVVEVVEHFAGYFDELGITVKLKPSTTDEDVRGLRNSVAPHVLGVRVPSQWMLMFDRNGESAGILFPDGLFTGASNCARVAIVVDPEADDLGTIAVVMPIWAVESAKTRGQAERFWASYPNANQTDMGFTVFKCQDLRARQDNLLNIIDTVEEHHWGFKRLDVLGLTLSDELRDLLRADGFEKFQRIPNGFTTVRVSDTKTGARL